MFTSDKNLPSRNKLIKSPAGGKRRIKIKAFSVRREDPEKLYNEKWPILQKSILAVFNEQRSEYNHEILYRHVNDLCRRAHMEERLYSDLRSLVVKHIQDHLRAQLLPGATSASSTASDSSQFLKLFVSLWTSFEQHIMTIRNIFLVLDRNYVLQLNGPIKSLWDMALDLFRTNIINVHDIRVRLKAILLSLIEQERNGNLIESSHLSTCLSMLSHLQVYETLFQTPLIEQTAAYYEREAAIQFQNLNLEQGDASAASSVTIETYLQWVITQIKHEDYRATHYFKPSTKVPLINTVYREIVFKYSAKLLNFGLEPLLNQNKLDYIQHLYDLLKSVNSLEALRNHFFDYVVKYGSMIVKDPQRDATMVEDLLGFKNKISHIHETCFYKSKHFNDTIKDAFTEFINSRPRKPAEMIAKFLNKRLQKGNKGYSDLELEEMMDNAMAIFKYIRETDVFEAFYKKDLAKRLLLGRSASSDVEKTVLTKLKAECGSEFTRHLEGMFKDMEANKTLMQDFTKWKTEKDDLSVQSEKSPSEEGTKEGDTSAQNTKEGDSTSTVSTLQTTQPSTSLPIHVFVITTGNWPPYKSCNLNLPPELAQSQKLYETFYLSKFSGRKLTWQNHLGRCTVLGRFPKCGERTLDVSLFQTTVLLLFNDAIQLSYAQIRDALGMEEQELKRTLQSLTCSRMQPLRKEPTGADISDSDEFYFNKSFVSRKMKIRINTIQMKETAEEQQETERKVLVVREHVIDAAIVRVMKARKQLGHQQLMAEVSKVLRFDAKVSELKKRVESLIERDFLLRDSENVNILVYAA